MCDFIIHVQCDFQLTLTFESVEVILESESTQKTNGIPILAVNATAVLQVSDWTSQVC